MTTSAESTGCCLQEDEAYVFVCYDSRAGRARFTPHTGFKDPSSSPDAFERER